MSIGGIGPIALLLAGIVILGASALLIRFGGRSRPVGDTPYCRRCRYDLTALTSDRCPECGTELNAAAIVVGTRRRRPIVLSAGVLVMLAALATIIVSAQRVNWYRFCPTAWVLRDLQSTKPGRADRVWSELSRREAAGKLSHDHRLHLIEIALEVQRTGTPSSVSGILLKRLWESYKDGLLTPEQTEQFFHQTARFPLSVRRRVAAGDPIPCDWTVDTSPCPSTCHLAIAVRRITVDGTDVAHEERAELTRLSDGSEYSLSPVAPRQVQFARPGPHTLSLHVEVRVLPGGWWPPPHDHGRASGNERPEPAPETITPLYKGEVVASAPFEILDAPKLESVALTRDPALAAPLHASITPKDFWLEGRDQRWYFNGFASISGPPVEVAFHAVLRANGREYPVGDVYYGRELPDPGAAVCWNCRIEGWINGDSFEACDLILRPSRSVAVGTLYITKIYDGELVFSDIPVRLQVDPAPAAPTTLPPATTSPTTSPLIRP